MDETEAIKQFLGEQPDTSQWKEWRSALELRLNGFLAERPRLSGDALETLDEKIKQVRRQIAALQNEEAVTQFVEDSVRVTLALGAFGGRDDDEE